MVATLLAVTVNRLLSQSSFLVQFLVLSFLLVAGLDQLSMANAQPTTGSNVIAEIRRALESNTELRNVVKYLNLSEAVLLQKLTQTG